MLAEVDSMPQLTQFEGSGCHFKTAIRPTWVGCMLAELGLTLAAQSTVKEMSSFASGFTVYKF